jgi:hypothetical protein
MNRVLQRHLEVVLEVSPRIEILEVTGAAALHDGKDSEAGVVVQKKTSSNYVVDFNSEHLPNCGRRQTIFLKGLIENNYSFAECSLRMAGNLTVRSLSDGCAVLQYPVWELEYKVELTKTKPTTCHVVLVPNQDERGGRFLVNYWQRTGEFRDALNCASEGLQASMIFIERRLKEDKTCLKRLDLW